MAPGTELRGVSSDPGRVDLTPAFVLHRRPWRETSLMLEIMSREHGRMGLIARGARRPGSRLHGVLQPFQAILISWRGRGELPTVTGAEGVAGPSRLTGAAAASGFYLNELCLRLLHRHDPHAQLHDAYADCLRELTAGTSHEPALRRFEKRLLDAIGYGLVLDRETEHGTPVEAGRLYWYVASSGPRGAPPPPSRRHPDSRLDDPRLDDPGLDDPGLGNPRPDSGPGRDPRHDPAHGAHAPVQVHGATLLALAADRLSDPEGLREAKRLMRAVLSVHLGAKPLASRSLFREGRGERRA